MMILAKTIVLLLMIGVGQAPAADAEPRKPAAAESLAGLDWLAGCWSGPFEAGRWEACYTTTEGGQIVSANKEILDGKVNMIEFEHFTVDGDDVVMTPFPFGRKSAASFKLTEYDPQKKQAVFANPAHDFPRRIVYEIADNGHLVIRITGEQNGKAMSLTLDLTRQN